LTIFKFIFTITFQHLQYRQQTASLVQQSKMTYNGVTWDVNLLNRSMSFQWCCEYRLIKKLQL